MFGIGIGELMLLLVIALIVLGPERMPKVARDLGRVIGELRRTSDELREEFLNADRILEARTKPTPTQSTPSAAPSPAPSQPIDPNETAFDREMREARERLRSQGQP
jgi:Tat protein translocase TatB subunit